MKRKEHKAIFKVKVPVTFSFEAGEFTDCEELWEMAKKEAEKHICNGDCDWKDKDVQVVDKTVMKTAEEIRADREWIDTIFGVARG